MRNESDDRSRTRDLRLLTAGGPSSAFALSTRAKALPAAPPHTSDAKRAAFKVDAVVTVYHTYEAAEQAIRVLQQASVDRTPLGRYPPTESDPTKCQVLLGLAGRDYPSDMRAYPHA